jgi:hypothetical protein
VFSRTCAIVDCGKYTIGEHVHQRRCAASPSTDSRSEDAGAPRFVHSWRKRDAPPPLDLALEIQTTALAQREQHRKPLPLQRTERMSDQQ